jgi:TolA-binding protein
MAAQMELERNNIAGAKQLLEKAAKYDRGNSSQRNKAYLTLAELAFANKDYRQAYNFYDSVRLDDPALKDVDAIIAKKEMLGNMATQVEIMKRQDSLQRIAGLPEEERKQFVTKLLKELRRQAGLKETGNEPLTSGFGPTQLDIFSMTQSSKGEWYFYNTALRTKGAQDFKARWGNRPNVDNWRRMQGVMNQKNVNRADLTNNLNTGNPNNGAPQAQELTFENLYNNLPLTPDRLKLSNDSIQNALFALGKILAEGIEDCDGVITIYEQLRNNFPEFGKMDEVLFHLYYCYDKNGDHAKAAQLKAELSTKYPGNNLTAIVMTGKDPKAEQKNEATKTYENIYDLFIEGKFDDAVAQKKIADSIYGENYWSPQLLYIESVYYIKQQNDSTAISELKKLQNKYPGTPLAEKATTMINVLGRRKQIEEELTNLKIEEPRPGVRKQVIIVDSVATRPQAIKADTATVKKPVTNLPAKNDSIVTKKTAKPILAFSFNAAAPHYVMIILNKVDVVFGNEAKNAFARYNSETFYNKSFELSNIPLDADNKLVLIKPFDNAQAAIDYINKVKPKAANEIVPWLKADKYSFSIITDQNLEVLKANPDLTAYKLFLDQNLPGKF